MDYNNEVFADLELDGEVLQDMDFCDCVFRNCKIENSEVIRCRFLDCKFENCVIRTIKFSSARASSCEFYNCTMYGINWSALTDDEKSSKPFYAIKDCLLKFNSFFNFTMIKMDFGQSDLLECDFSECNLQEVKLSHCNLEATSFFKCNLKKADFTSSQGYVVDAKTCDLKDSRFSFPEAISILDSLGVKLDQLILIEAAASQHPAYFF